MYLEQGYEAASDKSERGSGGDIRLHAAGRIGHEPEPSIRGHEPAADANPFFEEWALEAALAHLPSPGAGIDVVGVGRGAAATAVPLIRRWRLAPGMGSVWAVWDHIHCFDTTPPVQGDPDAALDAVFAFLVRNGAGMLRWTGLPTDTEFYQALIRYLERNGLQYRRTGIRQRPVLSGAAAGMDALNGKRMSEFRRRRRRLEELGRLEVRFHQGTHDADAWMRDFLALEASGWKGAHGTAIACNPDERRFFESLMRTASAQGKALVCGLLLDGRPIAMTVNLRTGSGIWGFKTAYDPEYARFSPGALCVIETTAHVLRDPSITWLDSCMDHDDGPAGVLWPERRQVVDLLISAKRSSNWLPPAAGFVLSAWRFVRNRLPPVWKPLGKRPQPVFARAGESRIRRIITGITSIVVLPEMPTVVLFTASM